MAYPCYVQEGQVTFVERCGKFRKVATPGVHWLVPCIDRMTPPMHLGTLEYPINIETQVKNNVFVTIRGSIRHRVARVSDRFHGPHEQGLSQEELWYNAWYTLSNVNTLLKMSSDEFLRVAVMPYTMDKLFTIKEELSRGLQDRLNADLNLYGRIVTAVTIGDIDPNDTVKKSMNDVYIAEKQKEARLFTAEAESRTALLKAQSTADAQLMAMETERKVALIKADGTAEVNRLTAEAESKTSLLKAQTAAEVTRLEGQAVADRLRYRTEAMRVLLQSEHGETAARFTLLENYITMMEAGAETGRNTYFLSASPGHMASIDQDLHQALLGQMAKRPRDDDTDHEPIAKRART